MGSRSPAPFDVELAELMGEPGFGNHMPDFDKLSGGEGVGVRRFQLGRIRDWHGVWADDLRGAHGRRAGLSLVVRQDWPIGELM